MPFRRFQASLSEARQLALDLAVSQMSVVNGAHGQLPTGLLLEGVLSLELTKRGPGDRFVIRAKRAASSAAMFVPDGIETAVDPSGGRILALLSPLYARHFFGAIRISLPLRRKTRNSPQLTIW